MTTSVQIVNHGPSRIAVSTVDPKDSQSQTHVVEHVNAGDTSRPVYVYSNQSVLVEELDR
ncbi:MAG TPA: hypothetical protein VFJ25_04595 [Casimicrobiaceae bacterium]|nr:hypothetical protein [Casimicrobiaceae bacterium]